MTSREADSWKRLVSAEAAYFAARASFFADPARARVLEDAVINPAERGTALRALLLLPPADARNLAPALVDQASVGHADVALVRQVLARIDRAWMLEHIDELVDPILTNGEHEEHRRLAELMIDLGASEALQRLLTRCRNHPSEDVREIADDFASLRSDRAE